MIGDYLTGLSKTEEAVVTLSNDDSEVKTKFVIRNLPGWGDLEVARIEQQFVSNGYEPMQGASYAWVSFGLVRIEDVNTPGDSMDIPKRETGKTKTGETWERIPVEWLIKNLPYRAVIAELSNAIFSHNSLSGAERKNWTWPPSSGTSTKPEDSTASGPDRKQENGNKTKNVAGPVSTVTEQIAGANTDCNATDQ